MTGIAALLTSIPAHGAPGEQFSVTSGNDSLPVSRYAATVAGKRPAVIVLHGSRGIELRLRAYERYADALSAKGIDVYFLRYMTPADTAALTPKSSTHESRDAYDTTRFDDWANTVSATVTAILGRSDSSGRIGLLGFSPGPCNISQQEIVKKELSLVGSRLNRRLLPEVVSWLESGRLKPAPMITQTFAAREAQAAFDLVERHPERTVKVQLAFDEM